MENIHTVRRVLIVIYDFEPTGVPSLLYSILSSMDKSNLCIDIAYNRQHSDDIFYNKIKPLVHKIFQYGGPLCYSSYFYIPKLFYLMKKNGPYDVIHINGAQEVPLISFTAWLAGIEKRIAHCHNAGDMKKFRTRIKNLISCWATSFATNFWACSQPAADLLYKKQKKANIVPNGIITAKFKYNPQVRATVREQLNIKNKFVIGHVGGFREVKNHAFILDILQAILKQKPEAMLLSVGSGGEDEQKILQKIKLLNLTDKVLLLGAREDLPQLYQAMDCFLFPSKMGEGFGIVTVEAQAAGLNCFISDAIPNSANLINTTTIPLNKSAEEWANIILKKTNHFVRANCTDIIRKKGFDIEKTANWIRQEYLK